MNILHIDSSILGEHSASRQLSQQVVAAIQALEADSQVIYRDVASDDLSHLSAASVAALNTPADQRSAAQQQEVDANEAILQEFLNADVLVVGAPMYNFTVPSQLKAWIDRIAVAGRTFRYSSAGYEGLCPGKKIIVVSTAGGLHSGQPKGVGHEDFLDVMFRFLGITDLHWVRAQGLAYGGAPRVDALNAAQQYIVEELLATVSSSATARRDSAVSSMAARHNACDTPAKTFPSGQSPISAPHR